jgi:hypothetical protein
MNLPSRLIDALAEMLDPDEREAVLGDISESQQKNGKAIRELLGLIARREAALWRTPRPWLMLVAMVAPIAVALNLAAIRLAEGTAIYSYIYIDNWTWGQLASPGARADLVHLCVAYLFDYVSLAGFAWAAGLSIGRLSGRAVRGMSAWLYLSVVVVALVPRSHWVGNASVFEAPFYQFVLPVIVGALCLVVPSLSGLHQGRRLSGQRPAAGMVMLVTAQVALVARAAASQYSALRIGTIPPGAVPFLVLLGVVPFVALAWPVVYAAVIVARQRWSGAGVTRSATA